MSWFRNKRCPKNPPFTPDPIIPKDNKPNK